MFTRKRLFWLGSGSLLISLGCMVAYHAIGTHIDEQGVLHEQFGFIPLALFWGLTGATLWLWALLRRK